MNINGSINKDKGMQTQGNATGYLAQYIALKWKMEGRVRAFSRIWKVKDCNHYDSAWKSQNIFIFEHKTRCT